MSGDATLMEPLTASSPVRRFQQRWRELQERPESLRAIGVAVAASFTVEPLLPYLGCLLGERRLLARFAVAPFNQVGTSLVDRASALHASGAEVTVVLERIEDLCPRPLRQMALLDPAAIGRARTDAHDAAERFVQLLAGYERATTGVLLCGTFPAPASPPLGVLDASHPASLLQLQRELNSMLWEAARRIPRLRLVDVDQAVAELGTARALDPRMEYFAGCPYSAAMLRLLGERLARTIAPLFTAPAKVIVLDLDNTLWGGVVGEDGMAGIAIGSSGLGAAFAAFQEALLALRAQGVLLCVASQNNEADAFEVLDHHAGMRLRREHLTAWKIGWQPKSESLRGLARELSLGLDSFVFIDDSPTECAEIRRLLPEVTVVQLPPDPARYVAALRGVTALDRMALTDEDRARAEQYRVEQARARSFEAVEPSDPEALRRHLRSLELHVVVRPLAPSDVARAAQLTRKTNQFNLTTVRRTDAEVAALRSDPRWRLYAAEVSDRFGDYGLTGLLFAERAAPDTWHLDTALLSCRVLGRGVESALLAAVIEDLLGAGARRLTGRFVPTEKNAPARDFLARHGFVPAPDPGGALVKEPLPGPPFDADHVAVRFVAAPWPQPARPEHGA